MTASCGSAHKFEGDYAFAYADTVAAVLAATGGRHVHIGPLSAAAHGRLRAALRDADIDPALLVHVAHVPALGPALWAYGVDVYLASFPVSGARARVEVLASGTPHVAHDRRPVEGGDPRHDASGQPVWRTWADLRAILGDLARPGVLERYANGARQEYDRRHRPEVFAARLRAIADDTVADDDVDPGQAVQALAAITLGLDEVQQRARAALASSIDRAGADVARLRQQIEDLRAALADSERTRAAEALAAQAHLAAAVRPLADAVTALDRRVAEADAQRGWRARLRRWIRS